MFQHPPHDRVEVEGRRCWETLEAQLPTAAACRLVVGLLWLAHDQACEAELAEALTAILDAGDLPDLHALQERFRQPPAEMADVTVHLPTAASYDALLGLTGAAA